MYFIGSKSGFTLVKSLLKLMLYGTVLGFVIESGSVLVNPSRVANASQTKIFLSNPSLPLSVDGVTVKEFNISGVMGGSDEAPPSCSGSNYEPPRLQAWFNLTAVNERLEPVEIKYRLQVTNPFTGEVLGEESIQDTIGALQYYTPFLRVYLDKMLNASHQLPDKLNLIMTIETNRSSIAYVVKAPEYIVREEIKPYYSTSRTESAISRESVGCVRPIDDVIIPKPTVVTPRKDERLQRRDVLPIQIFLIPVKKLSPIVPQKKLIPIKLQKDGQTRKTNVSAN